MSILYPCVYCTEDGYCEKYSDEEVTSWCVQGPCKDERPSNADRIRVMTDEELAEFMSEIMYCHKCWKYDKEQGICTRTSGCNSAILDWLKEVVGDA